MAEIPQNSFQGPLAPKIGLNESYRNPLPGGPKNDVEKKGRNYGRLIPIGAIALALLILPLTLNQLNQQQDIRQRASEPTPAITTLPVDETLTPTPSVEPKLPPPAIFDATPSAETSN